MSILNIPDHLESGLEASASRRGWTKEKLVEELLSAHVEEEFAAPETFSDAQITRFKESISQLDRGERVGSEEVEQFFEEWFKEIDAR